MIIQGRIKELTHEYDEIYLDDELLGDNWDWDEFEDKKVALRYFISDEPIASLKEAEEAFVRTLFGACDVRAHPVFGSEWTGQYGFDQDLTIGGHDLLEELRTHVGKYVLIEVKVVEDD